MQINIKLQEHAKLPNKATDGSCGYDLYATYSETSAEYTEYDTGVIVEIPPGYVGLVIPRSSISKIAGASLANSVGVIDQDYRGTIKCRFRGVPYFGWSERIAQLVIIPCMNNIVWNENNTVTDTVRGTGGFGSSGQ